AAVGRPCAVTIAQALRAVPARLCRHVPVEVVVGSYENECADQVRAPQSNEKCRITTVAPADEIGRAADEFIDDGDGLGGHVVVMERCVRVGRASMPAPVEGQDSERLAE